MEILGLITLPGWLVGILMFVLSICLYSWYKQNFYTRLGIKQKETTLFLGDLPIMFKKGFAYIDVEMVNENGKCFGVYLGNTPFLVVTDADMLKEIMVKQFSKFTDREIVIPLEKQWNHGVNNATGDRWRYLRNTLSPTFSSGKMRNMSAYIQRCQNNLLEILDEKRKGQGDGFDIVPTIRGYTMDVICTTGFGIEVDSQRNPDNPFVKYSREFFEVEVGKNPIFLLAFLFPELRYFFDRMEVPLVSKECFNFFKTTTEAICAERRKIASYEEILHEMYRADYFFVHADRSWFIDIILMCVDLAHYEMKHKDLLQMMLNANKENSDETIETNGQLSYEDHKRQGLTDEEILINSMVFMTAGYDTTAITLSWLTFELALNPEVQDKLIAEIDEKVGKDRPTYDNVFKLEYLDMVVSESLRMHPPASRVNRVAIEDADVCGVPIKKGMTITICISAIHKLPEYWPEPDKFDPERFAPKNQANINQFAYQPFGNGPRNCIGQRLALLEVKMTIVALLQKFRIVRSSKLQVPMPNSKLGLSKPAFPSTSSSSKDTRLMYEENNSFGQIKPSSVGDCLSPCAN